MADVEATVEVLNKLNLTQLDEDWVKDVWGQDFAEANPIPIATLEEVQTNDCHVKNMKTLISCLSPWAKGREEKGFWATLVENDLPHRSLVALIFHLLEQGDKRVATATQKEAGILAAELYFTLLRIPGSSAFKIFHPMLCQKAVDAFKTWKNLDNPNPKKRKPEVSSSQQAKRSKGRKRAKGNRTRDADNPFADEEEEEDGEEPEGFTAYEVRAIYQALNSLLKTFVALLSTYSFKDNEQMTTHCVQILTELTKIDPETFHGNFDESSMERGVSVPHLAYIGLTRLAVSNNGAIPGVISLVFKNLLPNLLMFIGENNAVAASNIPRSVQIIKDHAQSYVLYLMATYGAPVIPPVRVLLQHMCVKVPDKVEYRSRVASTVVLILSKLRPLSYAKMLDWIYKFSRNAKISYRSFALSLVSLLIMEPERVADETIEREYVDLLSRRFLLQMILSRCSDIAPTVRARAIQVFATCTSADEPAVKTALKDLVTPRPVGGRQPVSRVVPTPDPTRTAPTTGLKSPESEGSKEQMDVEASAQPQDGAANTTPVSHPPETPPVAAETPVENVNQRTTTPGGVILTPGGEISMVDGKGVISMLRRRAMDERVNVRKAALQALESLIRIEGELLNAEDLKILNERCLDPALSVRKQAMQSLTDLLEEMPLNVHLQKAWLDGVLPLVMDRETSAQEKCFETLEHILMNNIVPYQRSNATSHKMTWQLLGILASNEGVDLRRFLQRACQHWGRNGKLKVTMLAYLQTHVDTENNIAVWMFLSEIAPFVQKLAHGFVVDYWNNTAKNASDSEYNTVHRVLSVLGHVAKNIPADGAATIATDLKDRLMQFDSPPELVAVTVTALGKLCKSQSEGDKTAAKAKTDEWFTEILTACDRYLSKVILEENQDAPVDEDLTVRHLFTLGEIAQLCPVKTPKRVFMLVQSLIASPVITSIDGSSQFPSRSQNSTGSSEGTCPSTEGNGQNSNSQGTSPQSNVGSSQCLTQGSQFTQTQLSQFRGSRMSSRVRAYAFITLGKLCLQNEDLAKKCVAAMARELEVATDLAIRNNLIIILCDLCVRYTSVVDRFIDNIAACLKDDSLIVRKQTLTLITHLLQEDFLKWKGALFFRFIITLVDESKEIQEFAEFCLVHLLLQRHPGMFHHHFIECIFHFNSYNGHNVYNKFSQTDQEKRKFSMKGRANAEKRQRIYVFLLEHLADEHRFSLTAKLTKEVLGPVVDGLLPLDADSSGLIQDTLFILASKEIKLSAMKSQVVDEDAVEAQDMAAAVMNAAKKTLITQVMKKNVIENIVPTIIGLKHMLERHHSTLLKDLMIYLRELVADYKNEVKDIMAADRQLAKEIEFDLRKFEERQEEERLRQERELEQRSLSKSPMGNPLIQGSPPISPRGQRSPKACTPGRVGGSPRSTNRSPGSPKVVASPQSVSPSANKVNTPIVNRRTSISTLAIMNSARKAMEKARKLSSVSQPRGSKESIGSGCTTKRVGWADEKETSKALTETIASTDDNESVFNTPKQQPKTKTRLRAISTPSANLSVLGDITFHQGDLSMIPSTPDHLHMRASGDEEDHRPPMIHLMSPDQPRPKPRTWNIKSPADPLRGRQLSTDLEPLPLDLEEASEGSQKSREILAPKRTSKKNKQREQSDVNNENENGDDAASRVSRSSEGPRRGRQKSLQRAEPPEKPEKELPAKRGSRKSNEPNTSKTELDTSQTRRRSARQSLKPSTPSQELDTSQSRRRSARKK